MNVSDFRVSAIIPSIRPSELEALLQSMADQTIPFYEAVVVDTTLDGGSRGVVEVFGATGPFHVDYTSRPGMGTCASRNFALARSTGTWIYFLDDDMWLGPKHLETCLEVLSRYRIEALSPLGSDSESGAITWWRIAKSLFLMDNLRNGKLLPSGFRTPLGSGERPEAACWLQGGNAIVRRHHTEGREFDRRLERFTYAVSEDVDYFYGMAASVPLYSAAIGEVVHKKSPMGRVGQYELSMAIVLNHWYISSKHFPSPLNRLLAFWAQLGTGAFLVVQLIVGPRPDGWERLRGFMAAMRLIATGGSEVRRDAPTN